MQALQSYIRTNIYTKIVVITYMVILSADLRNYCCINYCRDLSRQNISCDCHMRWLLTWKNASVSHQLLGACFTPPRLAGRQLTELTPDQLDCNGTSVHAPNQYISISYTYMHW